MWNATTAWCAALEGAAMPKEREREAPHVQLRRPGRSEGSMKSFLLFFSLDNSCFSFTRCFFKRFLLPSETRSLASFSRAAFALSRRLSLKSCRSASKSFGRERDSFFKMSSTDPHASSSRGASSVPAPPPFSGPSPAAVALGERVLAQYKARRATAASAAAAVAVGAR